MNTFFIIVTTLGINSYSAANFFLKDLENLETPAVIFFIESNK